MSDIEEYRRVNTVVTDQLQESIDLARRSGMIARRLDEIGVLLAAPVGPTAGAQERMQALCARATLESEKTTLHEELSRIERREQEMDDALLGQPAPPRTRGSLR